MYLTSFTPDKVLIVLLVAVVCSGDGLKLSREQADRIES
jgi:hypothetical protein